MVVLPHFTTIGPKYSNPTFVKGGRSGRILSSGKSAIFCSPAFPLARRQTTHLESTFLATELPFTIQYFFRSSDSIWFLPLWPQRSWMCLKSSMETCESLGKMQGCFVSSGIADLCSRPPTLRMPSSSTGSSLQILLPLCTLGGVISSVAISAGNALLCIYVMTDLSAPAMSFTVRSCPPR